MTVWSNRFLIFIAAMGIFIAGSLSYTTMNKLDIRCGETMGCAFVQSSDFATFPVKTGIPVAYIGLAGYIGLFALALVRSNLTGQPHRLLAIVGFVMSAAGLLFSLYLTYAAIAIVGQKCIWCLSSLAAIVLSTIGHAALLQGDVPEKPDMRPGWLTGIASFAVALVLLGFSVSGLNKQMDLTGILLDKSISLQDVLPVEGKITGRRDAKVTLVEFADVNCPACRTAYPEVKKSLEKYGDRLRIAFRSMPLLDKPGHETSLDAAIIAEYAADQGLFWKYIDTMFAPSNKERIKDKEGLVTVATEAGLTRAGIFGIYEKQGDKPAKSDEYIERVEQDIKLAAKLGVTETPTYILYAEGLPPQIVRPSAIPSILDSSPYRELMK